MLGHPKYDYGDIVEFEIVDDEYNKHLLTGRIDIIDPTGCFFYNKDVCYDIMVKEQNMLYKHIREGWVKGKVGKSKDKGVSPYY